MTDLPHGPLRVRLRPEVVHAWTLVGSALDTRTPHRARLQASAWRAVRTVPVARTVLAEVHEARWHPALTVAAESLLQALHMSERGEGLGCVEPAQQASRAVLRSWGELKAEGDVRRVGARLGEVLDGHLSIQPGLMLAQVWNELPLMDAFVATGTCLTSRHPRTWTTGEAVAAAGAWDHLRGTLPLPEPSDSPPRSVERAAQIQQRLDVARMLLAGCFPSPSPGPVREVDVGASTAGRPSRPAPARAAMATPASAFNTLRASGALVSHLLGPTVECEGGRPLVDHWTIDDPVLGAWGCLDRAAQGYPTPRGQRAVWSTVRGLLLPSGPLTRAVERYMHQDWRGVCYYARQAIERAEPHLISSPRAMQADLPATAIEDEFPTPDPPTADPRAGPDLT
jgi:hypothetical protein